MNVNLALEILFANPVIEDFALHVLRDVIHVDRLATSFGINDQRVCFLTEPTHYPPTLFFSSWVGHHESPSFQNLGTLWNLAPDGVGNSEGGGPCFETLLLIRAYQ